MAKWNPASFLRFSKAQCPAHVVNVLEDLVKFITTDADVVSWGRGEETGMVTFKARSDHGILPLFNLTTEGIIKFYINYLREKQVAKEILRDYQLKLESTFLLDLNEEVYPTDVGHPVDDLFHTQNQVDKFKHAILGVTARLHQ
ncbi:MAG: hypothetical protein IIB43_02480 [Candidatus Marinimicrobia bacterium]|nr:hypothetical protein [Candidatus Neomarinimicrobiota bacterium]MCH7852018.1 hypothetical protein [Candidatus Neomarinimicrobiota bacterium]MCH8023552.1 hypothetical protein [Candidatus Neomarinimicrobiota bacterium]